MAVVGRVGAVRFRVGCLDQPDDHFLAYLRERHDHVVVVERSQNPERLGCSWVRLPQPIDEPEPLL